MDAIDLVPHLAFGCFAGFGEACHSCVSFVVFDRSNGAAKALFRPISLRRGRLGNRNALNGGRFEIIRRPFQNRLKYQGCHGWPFTVQKHHAPQGQAGRHPFEDVLQARTRNHRCCQDRSSRPDDERCASPCRAERQGTVDAEG
ncbi:hypothetical protein D3C87_1637670 [compost metagenome]